MTELKLRTNERVVARASKIQSVPTGVPGFDAILGGGLPAYSFNLIAGSPGSGKTTLAQQIIFANATVERPALYFTVLGEPTLKMLRYQQEFSFFDPAKIGSAIQYVNLSEEALELDLGVVLDRMVTEVERTKPGIVVVDSFRTFSERAPEDAHVGSMTIDHFVQRLALHLTTWEVTSFLIGEYGHQEQRNPVFTVADGVFWLSQVIDRNSGGEKVSGDEGSWALAYAGLAHLPHHLRRTPDLSAHSGAAVGTEGSVHTPPPDRCAGAGRDDGRRHPRWRRVDARRSSGQREDDVRHTVRR